MGDNRNAKAAAKLIRGAGFEAVTYMAEMVRPSIGPPHHRLPVQGSSSGRSARRHTRDLEGHAEAFRDHWGYVEQLEAGYQRFLRDFP